MCELVAYDVVVPDHEDASLIQQSDVHRKEQPHRERRSGQASQR
jgi:hypothetical protein